MIEADPVRLHQVITNLLANAIKFTAPEGKVIVQVRPEGPDAVLTVTDTGEGISADDIPMVFERFWRGRHSATTPGSGIGLAIVADLVQAHRGTVSVTSTVGEGSCFLVRLPAASGRF
ncbi:MAG: sensor histidine kinase [Frankiales bacterium]|nr:sensor histidine kinase [Frankiales bacterium]